MRKTSTFLLALMCTLVAWAQNNIITYQATEKLQEATYEGGSDIYINAFGDATITSHVFDKGTGTITFSCDVTTIGNYAFCPRSVLLTSITIPEA